MYTDSIRRQMVEQQVRTWDVFDNGILATFAQVSRELYVPDAFTRCAYADVEIPIGHGQCMLRPSLQGRILQAVNVQADDAVLEIGTGTGYLTRCLAACAREVFSIDVYQDFVASARRRLEGDGASNVTLQQMDASRELPIGDFDIVVVTASIRESEARFADLLRPGGHLFIVIGEKPVMTATLISHDESGDLSSTSLFETDIPRLVEVGERPPFSF